VIVTLFNEHPFASVIVIVLAPPLIKNGPNDLMELHSLAEADVIPPETV
jgi:hypothetical protein